MGELIVNLLLGLLWAASVGGIAWYCIQRSTQMTFVALADGRQQERRLPVLFRLLLPLAPNLTRFFDRPGFTRLRDSAERRLTASGYEGLLTPYEFLALQLLVPVVAGGCAIALLRLLIGIVPGRLGVALLDRQFILYTLILVVYAAYPSSWLRRVYKVRMRSMERALPFVLDLLTLSVEAGLDFMNAIQRIVERRRIDPLGEELLRMFREVLLGKTRREALRAMADRSGNPDLRTVVSALVQADELGVSIGAMLRIQADQMRTRRFQRAEKLANEAPVKMLFPLVVFIFPSVFIVLLGPVLLHFITQGF